MSIEEGKNILNNLIMLKPFGILMIIPLLKVMDLINMNKSDFKLIGIIVIVFDNNVRFSFI